MKNNLLYMLICIGFYSLFTVIEILAKPLVNYIGTGFSTHLIVYNVLLLIINPLLTKLIADTIYKKITA